MTARVCDRRSFWFFFAFLGLPWVGSCGGRMPWPVPVERQTSPVASVTQGAPAKTQVDDQLGIRLSDATSNGETFARMHSMTALTDESAARIFKSLPRLYEPPPVEFALPPSSLPPPQQNTTPVPAFPTQRNLPAGPTVTQATSVTLLHRSPVGQVWSAPFLSATFSEPMVPIGSYATIAQLSPPITITPQPEGNWRWLGTRTAIFQPKDRFPMATAFSVKPREGAKSITGAPFGTQTAWNFGTPAPSVTDVYPRNGSNRLVLKPNFFMRFDQEVDPIKMLPFVELTAGDKIRVLRLRSDAEKTDDEAQSLSQHEYPRSELVGSYAPVLEKDSVRQWIALRVTEPLPRDAEVKLTVKRGAPSAEGARRTETDQTFRYKTRGPLKLVKAPCGPSNPCEPSSGLDFSFNDDMDPETFKDDWVKVEPPVEDLSIESAYTGEVVGLRLNGRFRANQSYTVTFSDQLRDSQAQTLGQIVKYRFTVGSATPRMQLEPGQMVVLDPALPPHLLLQTINQQEVRAQIYQVQPADWPRYLDYVNKRQQPGKATPTVPGKLLGTEVLKPMGCADELLSSRLPLERYLNAGLGHLIVYFEGNNSSARWRLRKASDLAFDYGDKDYLVTWVQSTHIGIQTFEDQSFVRVWTMNLGDGAPLDGVKVGLVGNEPTAMTGADGLGRLRLGKKLASAVVAQKGSDCALLPDNRRSLVERLEKPTLRWFVVDSGGLYRPGETVHVKGWIRQMEPKPHGDLIVPPSTANSQLKYTLATRSQIFGRGTPVGNKGMARINATGEFDFAVHIPTFVPPGMAFIRMTLGGTGQFSTIQDHEHSIHIAEFERPEYEVAVTTDAGPHLVGASALATVSANYYTGGPLSAVNTQWHVKAHGATYVPPNWSEYRFGINPNFEPVNAPGVGSAKLQGRTDREGRHRLRIDFDPIEAAFPRQVNLTAAVSDLNSKVLTANANLLVHPAAVTVGVRPTHYLVSPGAPIQLDVIVTDLDGRVATGRPVKLRSELQPNGNSVDQDDEVHTCVFESSTAPRRCELKTTRAGTYRVQASVTDLQGRESRTTMSIYSLGDGNYALEHRNDHEAQLTFEQERYEAGDEAELLIVSPVVPAEGVLTLHRQGVAEIRRFSVKEKMTRLNIDVRPEYLPHVYVTADLVGNTTRRRPDGTLDSSLPPLASYAQGMTVLKLSNQHRKLDVSISPIKREVAPNESVPLDLEVTDPGGKPAIGARVAIMVVDESLLALIDAPTLDPLSVFYESPRMNRPFPPLHMSLPQREQQQAREAALRSAREATSARSSRVSKSQLLAEARAVPMLASHSPKSFKLPTSVRSDMSAVAAFIPNLITDSSGHARTRVKLPDCVTRYRVIAIASRGARHFGQGEQNFTAKLPLMLRPAAPRFLNCGDQFEFAVLVHNLSTADVSVELAARASNAQIVGPEGYAFVVPAGDRLEAHFNATARKAGKAIFQVGAASVLAADATQVEVPVYGPSTTEVFAHYGELSQGSATQKLVVPQNVVPEFGALEIDLSASALDGLAEAVWSLQSEDYRSNEARASRILTLCSLRTRHSQLKGKSAPLATLDALVRRDLAELVALQRQGEWDYWGTQDGSRSPWVSVHVTHALVSAKAQGFDVDSQVLKSAMEHLSRLNPPGHVPATRWSTLAYSAFVQHLAGSKKALVRARLVLSEAGSIEALPVEAAGWLLPVFYADSSSTDELDSLKQFLNNRITQTAAEAHFATTQATLAGSADAVVLAAFMLTEPDHPLAAKLAKGLLTHRAASHWHSNPETALSIMGLTRYLERHETGSPRFTARSWLDGQLVAQLLVTDSSSRLQHVRIPLSWLRSRGATDLNLVLGKEGTGRLHYRLGLSYAPMDQKVVAVDQGFTVMRTYESVDEPGDVTRRSDGTWNIKRGTRVRVRTFVQVPALRNYVALNDPLPAGLQVVDTSLAATPPLPESSSFETSNDTQELNPTDRARVSRLKQLRRVANYSWYDHHILQSDRVQAFASELPAGTYALEYIARALTVGTFLAPPPKAEEIHAPETFGRGNASIVVVH